MYDLIIIGGGVAGLMASIYATDGGLDTLIIEREFVGGQILPVGKITNFPAFSQVSGDELSENMRMQAEGKGVKFAEDEIVSIEKATHFTVKSQRNDYQGKAVIIACGTYHRHLDLPAEKALNGKGISYCAYCDGNFFKGKKVAVVGGGNTALYDSEYLLGICKEVVIIHRREEFRGDKEVLNRLKSKENVTILTNKTVTNLLGDKRLTEVELTSTVDNSTENIPLDGLFVALGRISSLTNITLPIDLTEDGYIPAGEDCKTSLDGLFVAGDCREKPLRQLVTAVSDGANSASSAIKYLNSL